MAHPPDNRSVDPQVVEKPNAVCCRVPVGERLPVEFGQSKATLVPRDDTVGVTQRSDLRCKHFMVH